MKFWAKLLITFFLLIGNFANAEQYKVLVLPVDLFNVCENYYCFPETSEIFADDVINTFSLNKKISTYNLYETRKKILENPQIKSYTITALNRFKNSNTVDFIALKKISEIFDTNSILLISSSVNQTNLRRNIWEILEITTAFEAYNRFSLETNAVLVDSVNDIVMWSGKYKRALGDNEARFWAKNMADATSHLEKLRLYSKEILSKDITENIVLRFYPKTIITTEIKPSAQTQTKDFRPNALDGINNKLQDNKDYGEIQSETIFTF